MKYEVVTGREGDPSQDVYLLEVVEVWDHKPINFLLSFVSNFNSYRKIGYSIN